MRLGCLCDPWLVCLCDPWLVEIRALSFYRTLPGIHKPQITLWPAIIDAINATTQLVLKSVVCAPLNGVLSGRRISLNSVLSGKDRFDWRFANTDCT
jgi:hypothetical protein